MKLIGDIIILNDFHAIDRKANKKKNIIESNKNEMDIVVDIDLLNDPKQITYHRMQSLFYVTNIDEIDMIPLFNVEINYKEIIIFCHILKDDNIYIYILFSRCNKHI